MIWIIAAILVVGYAIVKAIQHQTMVNAQIALQQQELAKQQLENTPEYQRQREISIKHFELVGDLADNQIMINQAKIRLIDIPSNQLDNLALKKDISDLEKMNKELQRDYEKAKTKLKGYDPEPVDVTAKKYGLDQTYSGDDWIRWDGRLGDYHDDQEKLRILQSRLAELEKDGSCEPDNQLIAAVRFMLNNGEADSWKLARALDIDDTEASELLETLQHKGLVHFNDKAFPSGKWIPLVSTLRTAQSKLG